MVRRVARIEVTVVSSETDALLLECNLIKAHRPRYNIILRDDKTFPYILCAPEATNFRGCSSGAACAGRPAGCSARFRARRGQEVLQQLQKVFRIRNCRDSFFAHRSRPCLQYQIGRCSAPCVGLDRRDDYRRDLDSALQVLEAGETDAWPMICGGAWRRPRESQQFELAAACATNWPASRTADPADRHRAARARPGCRGAGRRAGALRDQRADGARWPDPRHHQPLSGGARRTRRDAGRVPAAALRHASVPAEILINLGSPTTTPWTRRWPPWPARVRGCIVVAADCPARWVELAEQNAQQALRMRAERQDSVAAALETVAAALQLPRTPERIECFDISHTAGEGTVASCVVFGPEGAVKRDYRRYNISGIAPGDDYAALAAGAARHGARIARRRLAAPGPAADRRRCGPAAARRNRGCASAGCVDLRLVGASPRDPIGGRAGDAAPAGRAGGLDAAARQPGAAPAPAVRDEAHRFAITGHRRRRARRFRNRCSKPSRAWARRAGAHC